MKKILATLAITVVSAFAFTDNYSINESMAERYKAELRQCFNFLQEEPSSKKYFGNIFVQTKSSSYIDIKTANNINQMRKEQLLAGGYGELKQANQEDVDKFHADVNDLLFSGSLIASALKNGRESIFVENHELRKVEKIGSKNNFAVMYVKECNKNAILDRDIARKYLDLMKNLETRTWYFNGDLESVTAGSFKYNFKGSIELSGGGVSIYSRDSYMGYSLNRSNSLTKK